MEGAQGTVLPRKWPKDNQDQESHNFHIHDTSVSEYFTKLKGLWDELPILRPIHYCSCRSMKMLNEYE